MRTIEPEVLRSTGLPEEERFQAVLAELVNMMVGRVKRDALNFGAELSIAIPTTLVGQGRSASS